MRGKVLGTGDSSFTLGDSSREDAEDDLLSYDI
jgi:hypothetical protein